MIGNDIVDLVLARKESDWKRKGYLDKIFAPNEQLLIANAVIPDAMVWNLWSRKEAAYKIYNRETGIRGYFPLRLTCFYENETWGMVFIDEKKYFTKTIISEDCIHSVAVSKKEYFKAIIALNPNEKISKKNGIPFIIDAQTHEEKPVSISHHGRFWEAITIK